MMLKPRVKKTLEKWKRNPHDITIEEVTRILTSLGFEFRRGRKHPVFKHEKLLGEPNFIHGRITVPTVRGRKVKACYIKKVLKAIEIVLEG